MDPEANVCKAVAELLDDAMVTGSVNQPNDASDGEGDSPGSVDTLRNGIPEITLLETVNIFLIRKHHTLDEADHKGQMEQEQHSDGEPSRKE